MDTLQQCQVLEELEGRGLRLVMALSRTKLRERHSTSRSLPVPQVPVLVEELSHRVKKRLRPPLDGALAQPLRRLHLSGRSAASRNVIPTNNTDLTSLLSTHCVVFTQ